MAKLDWKKLEQAFRREHVKTGIKLQDWCRQNNISYDTARRYIKLRKHSPRNTEKSAQKNAQIDDQKSAQKSDGNSSHDELQAMMVVMKNAQIWQKRNGLVVPDFCHLQMLFLSVTPTPSDTVDTRSISRQITS